MAKKKNLEIEIFDTYTCRKGIEIQVKKIKFGLISWLQAKSQKEFDEKRILYPTFTVKMAFGESKEIEHDPDTIQNEADKGVIAIFNAIDRENTKLQNEVNLEMVKSLVNSAVVVPDFYEWETDYIEITGNKNLTPDPANLAELYLNYACEFLPSEWEELATVITSQFEDLREDIQDEKEIFSSEMDTKS